MAVSQDGKFLTKIKPLVDQAWVMKNCQHEWVYSHDNDCGDWEEEVYDCSKCGRRQYRELPD